jgi:hypothetical protein
MLTAIYLYTRKSYVAILIILPSCFGRHSHKTGWYPLVYLANTNFIIILNNIGLQSK